MFLAKGHRSSFLNYYLHLLKSTHRSFQGNNDRDPSRSIFKAWREKRKEGQRQQRREREKKEKKRGDGMKLDEMGDKGMERGRGHILKRTI